MNILDELYYGNISPFDHSFAKSSQYREALSVYHKCVERLETQLSEENKQLFEKVLDASGEFSSVSASENFKLGFRIGVQIMCSCFCGETISEEM